MSCDTCHLSQSFYSEIMPFWDSNLCSFKIHFSPLAGEKVKYLKSLCSASRIHPFLESISLEPQDPFQKMLCGASLHLHENYACPSTLPASLIIWSTRQIFILQSPFGFLVVLPSKFRIMKTVQWVIRSLIIIGPSISNSARMALVHSTTGKRSWPNAPEVAYFHSQYIQPQFKSIIFHSKELHFNTLLLLTL